MSKRLNRRELLELVAAASSLTIIPTSSTSVFGQSQQAPKPKLRSVVCFRFYGGWDVPMSCNPPVEALHSTMVGENRAWLTHFNFPSGPTVTSSGLSFPDNASATAEKSLEMQRRFANELGTEFFNRTDAGLRVCKLGVPGQPISSADAKEFVPIDASVGIDPNTLPFQALTADPGWVKASVSNPSLAFGPMMHQFLQTVDQAPGASTAHEQTYADYMTVFNGIDTGRNVSHDAGAVLSACGYTPPGIGNGADIKALQFRPSLETIMANELLGNPATFSPRLLGPSFVPALTFTYPGLRRGYSFAGKDAPLASLFDVTSLENLNQATSMKIPASFSDDTINKLVDQLHLRSNSHQKLAKTYSSFRDMVRQRGLGLSDYDAPEREAFNGMIDLVLEKAPLTTGANVIPGVRLFTKNNTMLSSRADWASLPPDQVRLALDAEREGSWQNNLATTARLVREGHVRGAAVSFGGHVDFIPDTHWHNDHVQTYYQGVFWDGVRRFMNYLIWNKDEEGRPLIETTLVVVSSDIIRGPVYFDTEIHGKSDYRNNSLILIGGGLNHSTQDGSKNLPGRIFGYTFGDLSAGRVDFATGDPGATPKSEGENPAQKLTFDRIYASVLGAYGMDHQRYFPDSPTLDPVVNNHPGKPVKRTL